MGHIGDLKEFDAFLRTRCTEVRAKLRDELAGHKLTLAVARRHRVLLPMVGVYTPGWQALPACSWDYVELVTREGLIGTGEWSIQLDQPAIDALHRLADDPDKNLLDDDLEIPLFMAWWDLVGQVLGKPLYRLWADLFDVGFTPPAEITTGRLHMAALCRCRGARRRDLRELAAVRGATVRRGLPHPEDLYVEL